MTDTPFDREAASEAVYERLFGPRDRTAPSDDPELRQILRRIIFGDVFATGDLDDRTRELITVTVLATLQALPQLRSHAAAALGVGVTPVELKEAVYQLAPFLGFPRVLNAVGVVNEVLQARGVTLPLEPQATTTDADRLERGRELQGPLYGTEIADALTRLPGGFGEAMPRFLTGFLFGDFYTRGGLDVATRELLGLCTLTALGLDRQIKPHVRGALRAGNSPERVLAALVHVYPYAGYPYALNAIRVVADVLAEDGCSVPVTHGSGATEPRAGASSSGEPRP